MLGETVMGSHHFSAPPPTSPLVGNDWIISQMNHGMHHAHKHLLAVLIKSIKAEQPEHIKETIRLRLARLESSSGVPGTPGSGWGIFPSSCVVAKGLIKGQILIFVILLDDGKKKIIK